MTGAGETVWTLVTAGAEETRAAGRLIAAALRMGDIVALSGDLGAGKTTLVQGIVAGLGGGQATSPTFTLVNEYEGRAGLRVIHADAYRLGESIAAELTIDTLGLDDLLGAGDTIVLIEWAERIAPLLPSDLLRVALDYGAAENERKLTISGSGPRSREIVRFLQESKWPAL